MSAATRSPVSVLRTANVTAAPASASARAVSTPIPDDAPVTMARLPDRSTPAMTSAAVDVNPKGVVINFAPISVPNRRGDRALSLFGDACDQGTRGVQLGDEVNGFTGPDRQVFAVAAFGRSAELRQRTLVSGQRGLSPLPCVGESIAQCSRGVALRPT